jgi:hypothetical protein
MLGGGEEGAIKKKAGQDVDEMQEVIEIESRAQ